MTRVLVILTVSLLNVFSLSPANARLNSCLAWPPELRTSHEVARRFGLPHSAFKRHLKESGLTEIFQSYFSAKVAQDTNGLIVGKNAQDLLWEIRDRRPQNNKCNWEAPDGRAIAAEDVTCMQIFKSSEEQARVYAEVKQRHDTTEMQELEADGKRQLCIYGLLDQLSTQTTFEGGWVCQLMPALM